MALRLQIIDDTNRHDHFYLGEDDECFYLYEYTAGAGWSGGTTNQLIHNLQKKKGDGGYHYKAPAIAQCARDFSQAINAKWLATATLVPVPPSKNKADPLFDDRMVQVCRAIRSPNPSDVREIVEQINSTDNFKSGNRKSPVELSANYRIAANELAQARPIIGVVDDVLTTGSHFKAVKGKILAERPGAKVVGFFIARRAIPNPFADVSIDDLLGQ
jgi:hypothetical protein